MFILLLVFLILLLVIILLSYYLSILLSYFEKYYSIFNIIARYYLIILLSISLFARVVVRVGGFLWSACCGRDRGPKEEIETNQAGIRRRSSGATIMCTVSHPVPCVPVGNVSSVTFRRVEDVWCLQQYGSFVPPAEVLANGPRSACSSVVAARHAIIGITLLNPLPLLLNVFF